MTGGELSFRYFGGNLFWNDLDGLNAKSYVCGYCNDKVSSAEGYALRANQVGFSGTLFQKGIYICPSCSGPTFFDLRDGQIPGTLIGHSVKGVPEEIDALYNEARSSYSVGAYTGAVLLSRKMLMNLAVVFGAPPGKNFYEYVDFLVQDGHVPKTSRAWVDHIRTEGNEATHKIELKSSTEAETLLKFIEMLLRINFEYHLQISEDPQND